MTEIYKDSTKSVADRVEDLLGRMTLREKVGQLNQRLYGFAVYERNGEEITLTENFKNEVAHFDGLGVLYGLYRADPWSARTTKTGLVGKLAPKGYNLVQKYVIEHSRLGIPMLLSSECPHGHQALGGYLLPVNLAVGATFHPRLLEEAGSICGKQLKEMGVNFALVSALDVLRDPRWGRSEECFSEDPYLCSEFAGAIVRGIQAQGVDVVAKHFCAQGEGTGGVNASAARIGERELREIHLPPAKACCEAHVKGIMAAYNEIDGVYCHVNKKLLTDILRGEFGFDGTVMADGVALNRLWEMTGDDVLSASKALKAGIDISLWDNVFSRLDEAVETGSVEEEFVDRAVRRVLTRKFEQGLFEHPYLSEESDGSGYTFEVYPQTEQLALESAVLLKNGTVNQTAKRHDRMDVSGLMVKWMEAEKQKPGTLMMHEKKMKKEEVQTEEKGVLPFGEDIQTITVIGPNADDIYRQLGDYTPPVSKEEGITVLEGMRRLAGKRTILTSSYGVLTDKKKNELTENFEKSDAIVLVLGGSSSRFEGAVFDDNGAAIAQKHMAMDCGEGVDVSALTLSEEQMEWFFYAKQSKKPVITVLIAGRPYAVPELAEKSDALLMCFHPGPAGGRAIARLLYGQESPSGRLPVSVPYSAGQLPVYYNHKFSYAAMNYADARHCPLYNFGEGFGYGKLSYGSMEIQAEEEKHSVVISTTVTNSGVYDDYAVAQIYIHDIKASTVRRVRELKAFRKEKIPAGESRILTLTLTEQVFHVWNENMEDVLEPGAFVVLLMDQGKIWDRKMITI